ncbi:MAG: NUDIX hydrolase [Candidatus Nanopelagicus sp.]
MSEIILAAGGVVWRRNQNKQVEVVIVHRPKYDDWSFPKGKADSKEALISCAYREIIEETNITTQFGPFIGQVEYLTSEGLKQVSYWAAKAIDTKPFIANSEVDQVKWMEISEVKQLLTMDSDKEILKKFTKLDLDSNPLILLRHAKALSRDEWQGDDDDRPLDDFGIRQANKLFLIYQVYNLSQIHTSDAIRCFSTVEPLTKAISVELLVTGKLSESTYRKDKEKAVDYVKALLKSELSELICSHNPILPKLLSKLTRKSEIDADEDKLQPAEAWVNHRKNKEIIQIDRLSAPRV